MAMLTNVVIDQTVEGQVVRRSYLLHSSEAARRGGRVVVAFHGRGEEALSWVPALEERVQCGDFIGVYPEGLEKSWNCGVEPSKAAMQRFRDSPLILQKAKVLAARM